MNGHRVMILGGDGFCGWPTALFLSQQGCEVSIVDNFSRRKIDIELGTQSCVPMATLLERVAKWKQISGRTITTHCIDVAAEFKELVEAMKNFRPTAVVHYAEQRSAPYSMISRKTKQYTVRNNVMASHNVLLAIMEVDANIHLVHLGTMGVYGYGTLPGFTIPEGYLDVKMEGKDVTIVHPYHPGSVYHTTKCLDNTLFHFYAKNDELRITDLHQGIIWGSQTGQTKMAPALWNRFDTDGEYGTVLNRFLAQAASGKPLTVYGTGGQTRAFIHIQDSCKCTWLAIQNPPQRGDRVEMFNQMTETHTVKDLAALIKRVKPNTVVRQVPNPRKELKENDLFVENKKFTKTLGLEVTRLDETMVREMLAELEEHKDRVLQSTQQSRALWSSKVPAALAKEKIEVGAEQAFMSETVDPAAKRQRVA
jgi:UDP-sulfoquinovose synthase